MSTIPALARPRSSPAPRDGAASGFTLAAAVLGFFMVTLDAVVVNVALPSIRRDLGGGITGLQWVVDGYTLMFAAVMMPSSLALIRQAYTDPVRRARAIAVWAMGGAVASSSGPVLSGLLSLVSWRLIFFVNVPAGAAALVLLTRTRRSAPRKVPFDWAGQVTAVLAIGALTYGAIQAGADGIAAPRVLTAFAVAAIALATFGLTQARGAHPMVPLGLFRSRTVSVSVAVGFAFIVGYYGLPFVMSLYLQQVRGLPALATGVSFLPMMLVGAALTPFSARLAERFGPRVLVVGGLVLMTAGLVTLGVLAASTPTWTLAALMVPVGLAGPLVMPPVTAVLLNSVPAHLAGTASGVFNTSRQVGGALAVAVFGALLAHRATFLPGLRTSLLLAGGIALAAAAASLLLTRHQTDKTVT